MREKNILQKEVSLFKGNLQSKPYPPWKRKIEVWYDLPARKVKAYVHEGFEANKTFIRRYDTKQEYLVRDDEFAECRRAYLSEQA